MKKIDTIIFDLDGTLLNTIDDLCDSVNYMLELCSYPTRTLNEVRSYVGNGVRRLIELVLPESAATSLAEVDRCLEIFSAHYTINKDNKTALYDGIADMLVRLKGKKYKMAIVSNKFDAAVAELYASKFSDTISFAIGERAPFAKKPAPDCVHEALRVLGSDQDSSVYVGDSEVDVMTATNSGLRFIGVTWGFRDKSVLVDLGASVTIDEPTEIENAIAQLEQAN